MHDLELSGTTSYNIARDWC